MMSDKFRSILTVAKMGFFSSDRAIQTYCDEIWNTEPMIIEKAED
jgi:starch phosphorylase